MYPKPWIALLGMLAVASAFAVAAPEAGKPAKNSKKDAAVKEIILTVNGEKVTRASYDTLLESVYGEAAKDTLIDDVVIRQQQRLHGIRIGKKEIDNYIDRTVQAEIDGMRKDIRARHGRAASLDRYLRLYRGTNVAEVTRKSREARKKDPWLIEKILVLNRLKYYHDQIDEKVAVQFILLGTEKAAKRVLESLKQRARFDVLIRRESLDFLTRAKSGSGIRFRPGDYKVGVGIASEAFDKAARELKVGEISGIIKTDAGYVILKKLEHFKPKTLPYAKLKDKIDKLIATRHVFLNERGLCLARIRADAKIEEKKK